MPKNIFHWWNDTSFSVSGRVYFIMLTAAALFAVGYFFPILIDVAALLLLCLAIAVLTDAFFLYRNKYPISIHRILPDRFSNGDENKVMLNITNRYSFKIFCSVVEDLPFQFQERKWRRNLIIEKETEVTLSYYLQPKLRGKYTFGSTFFYVQGVLKLVSRRFVLSQTQTVKVYPSYLQMRRFALMAVTNTVQQSGVKRLRKLGHSLEFEQIKEYVRGDDYRTVNWKATARHGHVMVNNFTDERSQQIYCIINKGRVMKMPFDGMMLLDYAINAALVISNLALQKNDKAGLITFSKNLDTFLPADKKHAQLNGIIEALYKQQTEFGEPDFEKLFSVVRNRITHRSLLVLFTNFESNESLQREMPALKRLAHYHLLLVVFFENTEIKNLTAKNVNTTEDIYINTIAEKYRNEKKLMVKELRAQGILALLTTPKDLSINAVNKYLELKNGGRI